MFDGLVCSYLSHGPYLEMSLSEGRVRRIDSTPSLVFCRSLSLFPSLVIRPHLVEFSKLALAFSLLQA